MDLRFLASAYLFLLLAVPLVWFWPARLRDARHGLLRTVLLVGLIVGLARPVLLTDDDAEYQVFVLDRSASVAAASRDAADVALRRMVAALPSAARPVLVELGAAADGPGDGSTDAAEQRADSEGALSNLFEAYHRIGGSDLGAALSTAARQIPRGSRGSVTLLSDGAATAASWATAAQQLSRDGIPVHVVPLKGRAGDVFPSRLYTREDPRVGQTARVYCDIVGNGTVVAVLRGDNGELSRMDGLRVEGVSTAVFEFEPDQPGFLSVEVQISAAGDAFPDNNQLARTIPVQDPLRVLYLGDRVADGGARLNELLGRGFDVHAEYGPIAASFDDGTLDGYDVVFVDDRPAATVPESVQQQLVDAVTDRGKGLVVSGGQAAFGPGGYHGSTVADALPVESLQKEEKRDPSTTLVLIIDTSGSMGGMRVTLAKEVARLAMRRLLPHDKVGIVEFYGAKRWAAPIQPASNLIELQRALNRLDAGGGTVILPAIEEAFYGLQNVETRYKHVLILTDGGVETGAFEPLLRKMSSKGVNTSTVLVGGDAHSEFLVTLANWGKGRFYSVPNRFSLPEIILKQPASAQLPAYRPGSHVVRARGGEGWWGGTDVATVPPLAGYVETKSRPGAVTLLETATGTHPILSSWRYGLGRVTALTTEPTGPGTAPWRDWSGYGPWLARVLTRTASAESTSFAFDLRRSDHRLIVTAERRMPGEQLPTATLVAEDGTLGAAFDFRSRAPGVFTAELVMVPEQEVRVLAGSVAQPGRLRLASSPRDDVSAELQVDPRRGLDLVSLAAATGGAVLDTASAGSIGTGGGAAPVSLFELWPWCLLLALIVFVGELFYRRRSVRQAAA